MAHLAAGFAGLIAANWDEWGIKGYRKISPDRHRRLYYSADPAIRHLLKTCFVCTEINTEIEWLNGTVAMLVSDEELVDLIYMALLGEASWQLFLERMAGALPDGKAAFFAQGFGRRPEFAAIHAGFDENVLRSYGAHFAARNPWVPAMEATKPGRSLAGHRLCPLEDFWKSEFFNDWFLPNNMMTSGGVVIERNPEIQFNLTFISSQTDHALVDAGAAQLARLSPHLQRAARFYANESAAEKANEFGASLLEAIDVGVLFVAHGPRLKLASKAAEDINAETGLFRFSPVGRLYFVQPEINDIVCDMLRRNYEGPKTRAQVFGHLSVTLLRHDRDGLGQLLQGPSVVVIMELNHRRSSARKPEDLQRDYGLTKSELRILMGLLDGQSLPEIARLAGVSHETVRTQQRTLFDKLDVNSQIQLLNRVYRDGRIG